MRKFIIAVLWLCMLFLSVDVRYADSAPCTNYYSGTGHCYTPVLAIVTWDNAKTAAEAAGGYLATITSSGENDFVYSLVSGNNAYWWADGFNNGLGPWLGGYQPGGSPEPAGGWTWVSGEPWFYANWAYGEPSNGGGGTENTVHYFAQGTLISNQWNDVPSFVPMNGYIIEFDCAPPPSDMVSWWPGDNSAIDIQDSNSGTLFGNTTYADGLVGKAFSFDGNGDYVSIPDAANLDITNAITIDAWIKPAGSGVNNGIIVMKNPLSYGLVWLPASGQITLSMDIGGWADHLSVYSVPVGQWTHVAGTYDGSNVKIYINGILDATYPQTGTIATSSGNLTLGARPDFPEYYNGLIDEVEIYNRALTAQEIAAIYNAGAAGKCRSCVEPPTDMVSWWSGDGHPFDLINTNDGTMMNGATYFDGKVSRAFSFDGVDDYVAVSLTSDFPSGNSARTIDAWFKTSAEAEQEIIHYGVADLNKSTYMDIDDTSDCASASATPYAGYKVLVGTWGGGTNLCGTTKVNDGLWHHAAATYDGTTWKLYVDGILQSQTTAIPTNTENDLSMAIGHIKPGSPGGNNYAFNGLIDEVEIFNRALTADEIAAIYAAGSAGKCKPCFAPPSGMISWWPFDEGTGTIANDFIGINTGSVNGATWTTGKVDGVLSFDGVDDYVFASNTLNIDGGPEATYDAWVFPKSAPDVGLYYGIVGAGDSTQPIWPTQQCRILYWRTATSPPDASKFYIDCGTDNAEPSYIGRLTANDYPINNWHSVAGVFNNGSLDIYVNGMLDNGAVYSVNPGTSINTNAYNYVWVGAHVRNDQSLTAVHFDGLIDEVEIFSRALNAEEIAAIYAAGSAGKCKTSSEPDADNDGVPDATDNCPDISNPGQEDADSDTFGDACEECDNDPNKTLPGTCGCGVADTDTDQDGTPDCNDQCDNDPNKTTPGICGCGVADTDTDTDGVPDCNDNCDASQNADQADSDSDGVGNVCDNCISVSNPDQQDTNHNGIGEACENMSDLSGQWISAFYVIDSRSSYDVYGKLRVSNTGKTAAKSFTVSYYLSQDGQTLNSLIFKTTSSVLARNSKYLYLKADVPSPLAGTYIIAVIDSLSKINESNELNNRAVQLMKLK